MPPLARVVSARRLGDHEDDGRRFQLLAAGAQAAELGIVSQAVPAPELAQAARAPARRLAELPTIAVGYMKKNLNAAAQGTLSDVLDFEAVNMVRTMMTEDHKAASRAFVEKRAPRFTAR